MVLDQVQRNLAENETCARPINLKLSILKPIGFQWSVDACDYIATADVICNGFQEAGIVDAVANNYRDIQYCVST